MNRRQSPFMLWGAIVLFLSCWAATAQAQGAPAAGAYAPDRIIVKFKSEGANAVEADAAETINNRRPFQGQLPSGSDSLDRICEKYKIRRAKNVFMKRNGMATSQARQMMTQKFRDRYRKRVLAQVNAVGFSNMPTEARALRKLPDMANTYMLECEGGCDVAGAVKEFGRDPHVEFAQPDYSVSAQYTPNDLYYNTPFNAGSWGQNYADQWPLKADKMDLEPAWDLGFGAGIVVAVVDSGIDYNHPDINLNVYQNTGEFFNGLDDDGNGYIDDIRGWDFQAGDNDPLDAYGHGTHVSGIIAAEGNNSIGITGVAPQAQIMPLRALDNNGNGITSNLAAAIYYAADNGADIINNSWGCTSPCPSNPVAEQAVAYAAGLGVISIFSAGNSSEDARLYSPQNMEETITVSASTETDNFASFSNFGPAISLAAPGAGDEKPTPPAQPTRNVLSLLSDFFTSQFVEGGFLFLTNGYSRQGGTSMAAPHVSGLAALVLAHRTTLTPDEVMLAIAVSAEDLGAAGNDPLFGFGRVNASGAMTVPPSVFIVVNDVVTDDTAGGNGDGSFNPGESIDLSVTFGNEWIAANNVDVTLTTANSSLTIDTGTQFLGSLAAEGTMTVDFTFTIDPATPLDTPIDDFQFQFTHDGGSWIFNLGLLGYVTAPTLTEGPSLASKSNPDVSGDRVVWQDSRNGNADIYMYDTSTGILTQVTTNTADQTNPKISGNIIVWEDFRNGNWDIFMYNIALSSESQVTASASDQRLPAVDGNRIVWEDARNGNSDIYWYDIAGNQINPVTNDAPFQFNPDIEGDLLVWDENGQIYYYDFNVGTPTPVTSDAAQNQDPAVSGDVIVWGISNPVDSIRMFDISVGTIDPVASTADLHFNPDISGDYIVWQDGRNGKRDIYASKFKSHYEGPVTNQGGTLWESDHPAIDGLRVAWDGFELQTGESRIQTAAVPDNVQILYGDVNGDGNISSIDASLAARHAVLLITLSPEQIAAADVNGSGDISSIDASLIARHAVGLITQFPVEQ